MSFNIYSTRRGKLLGKLKDESIAIITSNGICYYNVDTEYYPFRQNSNLLYLTGLTNPNIILIIIKSGGVGKEILFVKKQSQKEKIWQGENFSIEQIAKVSGVKEVIYLERFRVICKDLISKVKNIYVDSSELARHEKNKVHILEHNFFDQIPTDSAGSITINRKFVAHKDTFSNLSIVKHFKEAYSKHSYLDLMPHIQELRAIKNKEEICAIRQACLLTGRAFEEVFKIIKPNIYENDIEAEFIYHFKKMGGDFAYPPIVASGANACILHYEKNNEKLYDGDMVLLDIGIQYKGYNADISRTIPVNKKFTKRQLQVYNSVLLVLQEAKKLLKPGITFEEYNTKTNKMMEDQLMSLNLISQKDINTQNPVVPVFRKNFPHSISHHLGIDVHDPIDYNIPITEGMVLTVEPGIYIKEERIGIRLENNVVVTSNGVEDLSEEIPVYTRYQ